MTKILISGSRNFTSKDMMIGALLDLAEITNIRPQSMLVIHGGAEGADALAEELKWAFGYHTAKVDALWKLYGRAAGPLRNHTMLLLQPDYALLFHDDISTSKGTKHMRELVQISKTPYRLYSSTDLLESTIVIPSLFPSSS